MLDEHAEQARHHESQRERMTYLIVAISAALIAFIGHEGLHLTSLLASAALVVWGCTDGYSP